jgi:hypothetical protein
LLGVCFCNLNFFSLFVFVLFSFDIFGFVCISIEKKKKSPKDKKYFNLVVYISSFFCLMHLECPLCAHASFMVFNSLCLRMFLICMSCHIVSIDFSLFFSFFFVVT